MGSIAENKKETLYKLEQLGHECGVYIVGRDRVGKLIESKMTDSTYTYLVNQWVTAILHAVKDERAEDNIKRMIEYSERGEL